MMKHTEGPWRKVGGSIMDSRGNEVAERKSRKHETKGTGDISPTEADANARLIAAAPDLLWACECILNDLNIIMSPELVKHFGASRILLRNAIDRAKGEDGNE